MTAIALRQIRNTLMGVLTAIALVAAYLLGTVGVTAVGLTATSTTVQARGKRRGRRGRGRGRHRGRGRRRGPNCPPLLWDLGVC
jgi:hypothetical protein